MNVAYSTPVLENLTSKGLKKFWQGHIVTDGTDWFTTSGYWQLTASGEESVRQSSMPYRVKGKNLGKKNETSPETQARSELDSEMRKKMDKGYHESGVAAEILPLPMLAHKFVERKHTVTYPAFAQPKLDGCRCLMRNGVAWSRGGKKFIPEVYAHLAFNTEGHIVDGELLLPSEAGGFQDSVKAVKKHRPELSSRLEYHLYDVVSDAPYRERRELLQRLVDDACDSKLLNIGVVLTDEVTSEEDVYRLHDRYVEMGFEGIMVRAGDKGYVLDHRDNQLLKYKYFVDDEFTIVGVVEGGGKEEGCAIFVCETPDKKTFNVRPKGSKEYRQELWAEREALVGQPLTVRYQNLSDDGIPRFPVGLAVRDYE
mgnify:CR=1 FL=1